MTKMHSRRGKRMRVGIVLAAIVLVALVLGGDAYVSRVVGGTGSAAWSFRDSIGTQMENFFTVWRSKIDLREENERLSRALMDQKLTTLRLSLLIAENALLKDLNENRTAASSSIIASVLVRPPQSFYDTLVVSAGERRGVRMGNRVYGPGGVLVGTITETSKETAKVALLSSPGEKRNVVIETDTASAIARGAGMGNFVIDLPRDAAVAEGDMVLLADGMDMIGIVGGMVMNDSDAFKKVYARIPFNMRELTWVRIDQ